MTRWRTTIVRGGAVRGRFWKSPVRPEAASAGISRSPSGYTLIEVMVAAGIIAVGIAAAALMAMTMVSQQEASARVVRALNYQEQAARLYQLGLERSVITTILPLESGVISLNFDTNSVVLADVGTVDVAVCELIYDAGSLFSSDGAASQETNSVVVVRPSTR